MPLKLFIKTRLVSGWFKNCCEEWSLNCFFIMLLKYFNKEDYQNWNKKPWLDVKAVLRLQWHNCIVAKLAEEMN